MNDGDDMKTINFKKNQKGFSIVMVLIITTILSILGTILYESVMHNYKITRKYSDMDRVYTDCHSAINEWRIQIEKITEEKLIGDEFYSDYDPENLKNFLQKIVSTRIKNNISGYDSARPFDPNEVIIDGTNIKLLIDIPKAKISSDGEYIETTFGLYAQGSNNNYITNVNNRRVYQEFDVDIKIPKTLRLLGGIYSVGDVYSNNTVSNIYGDIYVFGTFPKNIGEVKQHGYGGLYAKDGATFSVDGNVYTRSNVRTGAYKGISDSSTINVTKDIIAQSVMTFGHDSNIYGYRNVYTLDDIEINSENSVIGVRGSFIGLSPGGEFHDQASGIVNSSLVHNMQSNESQKSRIVINGDVIIPGGIFRIDASGVTVAQVEDAGVGLEYLNFSGVELGIPFYKMFNYPVGFDAGQNTAKYHNVYLAGGIPNPDSIKSKYLNDILDPKDGGTYSVLVQLWNQNKNISDWKNAIDAVRGIGQNDYITAGNLDKSVPGFIYGFMNYEVAANDDLYFAYENPFGSGIIENKGYNNELRYINNGELYGLVSVEYWLDNIWEKGDTVDVDGDSILDTVSFSTLQSKWNSFWDLFNGSHGTNYNSYKTDLVDNSIKEIRENLNKRVNQIVQRYYTIGDLTWTITDDNQISKKLFEGLDLLEINTSSSHFHKETGGGAFNLSTIIGAYGNSDYKLVYITNHLSNVEITGVFNGIIVTKGKVTLNGATVNGAIIAYGPGVDGSPILTAGNIIDGTKLGLPLDGTDATDIPYLNKLDNGDYASVKFIGAASTIDFYCGDTPTNSEDDLYFRSDWGRTNLLNKLRASGLELNHIF